MRIRAGKHRLNARLYGEAQVTTARLHKVFPQKYRTVTYPRCPLGETLEIFSTLYLRVREARTEARRGNHQPCPQESPGALLTI